MKNPFRRTVRSNDRPVDGAAPPNQGRTHEPPSEVLDELDALDAACNADPGDAERQMRLSNAVGALDRWVFINRGPVDDPRPYAIGTPHGTLLCVYSSGSRAQEAAYENELVPPDASVSLLAIPMPGAIGYVQSFAGSGVAGITLDHPRLGGWWPLASVSRFRTFDAHG